MKNLMITLATSFALSFAIAACGGPDEGEFYDESTDEITASRSAGQAGVGAASEREPTLAGEHGYCCNEDTGLVSKTQESGCDASDEDWHSSYADCVNLSVCGSNCNIN